jgi:hypothetical protein
MIGKEPALVVLRSVGHHNLGKLEERRKFEIQLNEVEVWLSQSGLGDHQDLA